MGGPAEERSRPAKQRGGLVRGGGWASKSKERENR